MKYVEFRILFVILFGLICFILGSQCKRITNVKSYLNIISIQHEIIEEANGVMSSACIIQYEDSIHTVENYLNKLQIYSNYLQNEREN